MDRICGERSWPQGPAPALSFGAKALGPQFRGSARALDAGPPGRDPPMRPALGWAFHKPGPLPPSSPGPVRPLEKGAPAWSLDLGSTRIREQRTDGLLIQPAHSSPVPLMANGELRFGRGRKTLAWGDTFPFLLRILFEIYAAPLYTRNCYGL